MAKIKKVLVTGADGFLGSHLLQALIEKGYYAKGLYFKTKGQPACDIQNFKEVLAVFKKFRPEAVLHTAAVIPAPNVSPNLYFETNVSGTFNLLESCRLFKVKKFIFSSSMAVYGRPEKLPVDETCPANPRDFYGLSKKMAEDLVCFYAENYGLETAVLRYAGMYGLGKNQGAVYNFIKNALASKPLVIEGTCNWDILAVEDAVLANLSALEKKFKTETINIGSGKQIGLKQLAEKIVKITNSKSRILSKKSSLPPIRFWFNISKAQKLLNFKSTNHDTALKAFIAQIKQS